MKFEEFKKKVVGSKVIFLGCHPSSYDDSELLKEDNSLAGSTCTISVITDCSDYFSDASPVENFQHCCYDVKFSTSDGPLEFYGVVGDQLSAPAALTKSDAKVSERHVLPVAGTRDLMFYDIELDCFVSEDEEMAQLFNDFVSSYWEMTYAESKKVFKEIKAKFPLLAADDSEANLYDYLFRIQQTAHISCR